MIASAKIFLLLTASSTPVYIPLIYDSWKDGKRPSVYTLFAFVSMLVYWDISNISPIKISDIVGIGQIGQAYNMIAIAIPFIAVSVFFSKKLGYRLSATETAIRFPVLPRRLERLMVFLYKVLLWLFLGAITGTFTANMQGYFPIWSIPIFIILLIAIGWIFVTLFMSYLNQKYSRNSNPQIEVDDHKSVTARIEQWEYEGIKLLEKQELIILKLTVFTNSSTCYQTTIRQFLTCQEAALLYQGKFIQFHEDRKHPGYGTVSITSASISTPFVDHQHLPTKTYPLHSKTRSLIFFGQHENRWVRILTATIALSLFTSGFLSPYEFTGNTGWLILDIKRLPDKLIFQDKGNFKDEEFRKTYETAIKFIGNRKVESLLIYKNFTSVTVEKNEKPNRLISATIRGNSISQHFSFSDIGDHTRLFTINEQNYSPLKKVLSDIEKNGKLKDIIYIGFRRDTRWGSAYFSHRKQTFLNIHAVFDSGDSFHYDGATGKRLPK